MYEIFWEGKPYETMLTLIPHNQIIRASRDVPIFPYREELGNTQMGIDWGFKDPTVVVVSQLVDGIYRVISVTSYRREEFKDIHTKIKEISRLYNCYTVYADSSHIGENQRLADLGLNVTPIKFRSTKEGLQSRLRGIFNTSKILIPDEYHDMLYQLKKYTWDTHTKDDYVDALMLSVWKEGDDSGEIFWHVIRPKG